MLSSQGVASLSPPAAPTDSSSRPNPLVDLIDSERKCIEQLSQIIKRVASAWSRSNLPPPEVDAIFRAIEAVYRVNKSLLARLEAIGPNPASPKALGDLLMRWTDELEPAYTRYVTVLHHGFDLAPPVRNNPNVQPILTSLPGSPTLDSLFEIPLNRVRYYKRLYAKLLRGSQPGRSDHKLLTAANEKLDSLLRRGEIAIRRPIDIPDESESEQPESDQQTALARSNRESDLPPLSGQQRDEEDSDFRSRPGTATDTQESFVPATGFTLVRQSSERDSGPQDSFDSNPTVTTTVTDFSSPTRPSTTHTSTSSHYDSTEDIESQLDTSETLDLFSMNPKSCRLQINPPSLTYTRTLRCRADVFFHHIPSSDPQKRKIQYSDAHLILLTDLFLVCRRIERSAKGKTHSLVFPPLSAKHLRVTNAERDFDDELDSTQLFSQDKVQRRLDVTVMKRETLSVTFTSSFERESWKTAFEEAQAFAAANSLKVKTDTAQSHTSPSSGSSGRPLDTGASFSPWSPNLGIPDKAIPSRSGSPLSNGNLNPIPPRAAYPANLGNSPDNPNFYNNPTRNIAGSASIQEGLDAISLSTSRSDRFFVDSPARDGSMVNPSPFLKQPPVPPPLQQPFHPSQSPPPMVNFNYASPQRAPSAPYPGQFLPGPYSHPPPMAHGPSIHRSRSAEARVVHPTPVAPSGIPGYNNVHGAPSFGPPPIPNPTYDARASSAPSSASASSSSRNHFMYDYPSYRNTSSPPSPTKTGMANGRSNGLGESLSSSRDAHSDPNWHDPKKSLDDDYDEMDEYERTDSPFRMEQAQIIAQIRCKVFLKQQHAQWKPYGTASLTLYLSKKNNVKQLVVESDSSSAGTGGIMTSPNVGRSSTGSSTKAKNVIISTIVMTDGVERVGKTGVAIELSRMDRKGNSRTGIVYMLQMKNEKSAKGLFEQLLLGSDRAPTR